MKITAEAPSNIAFIKYWGLVDSVLRIPTNGSISMNLSGLKTTTTVEFADTYTVDDITINGTRDALALARVSAHLDRIRKVANIDARAKVVSKNNFPTATGLSSSASGFAALTVAASRAAGLDLSEKDLSILARQASGSACRSIPGGFVEWISGTDTRTSYAQSIFPADWWDIVDIVVTVSHDEKKIATTKAQQYSRTSPFFKTRLANIDEKIKKIKECIKNRDFISFGELVEAEALELHAIMMTSNPSFLYLYPETLRLMHLVQTWRSEGLPVYFSLNTGHNIHIISQSITCKDVLDRINRASPHYQSILCSNTVGTLICQESLF